MDDVDNLLLPADLHTALQEHSPALENYHAFPDSAKRDILRWIKLAKKPETRAKRILAAAKKPSRINGDQALAPSSMILFHTRVKDKLERSVLDCMQHYLNPNGAYHHEISH